MLDRLVRWLQSAAAHRLGLAAIAPCIALTAVGLWLRAAPETEDKRPEVLHRLTGWLSSDVRDDFDEQLALSQAFYKLCIECADAVVAEALSLEAAAQRVHDHCVLHYPNHLRQIKRCYGDLGSSLAEVRIGLLLQIRHDLWVARYQAVPPAVLEQLRDIPPHL